MCAQVTQALTLPTTRSLCQARGSALYMTMAADLFTGSGFKGRPKEVCTTRTSCLLPHIASGCRHFSAASSFDSRLNSSVQRLLLQGAPGRQRLAKRFARWNATVGGTQNSASAQVGVSWHRPAGCLVQTKGSACCRRGMQPFRW